MKTPLRPLLRQSMTVAARGGDDEHVESIMTIQVVVMDLSDGRLDDIPVIPDERFAPELGEAGWTCHTSGSLNVYVRTIPG